MKHYTFSDMNRQSGEILEKALIEPISLTKRGKEKLVILTAARYRQLMGQGDVASFTLENAPDDIQADFMAGVDALIESDAQ